MFLLQLTHQIQIFGCSHWNIDKLKVIFICFIPGIRIATSTTVTRGGTLNLEKQKRVSLKLHSCQGTLHPSHLPRNWFCSVVRTVVSQHLQLPVQFIQEASFSSVKPFDAYPIQVNRHLRALKHFYLPRSGFELNQSIY